MGKYLRKSKISDNVGLTEVSPSTLGVCTRAKTLALQRLQSFDASCYLQLRSRRLEKPSALKPQENTEIRGPVPGSSSPRLRASDSVNPDSFKTRGRFESPVAVETGYEYDLDAEASFGENNLEFEPRERSSRESTPCSLIRDVDVTTPGSSTKRITVNVANQNGRSAVLRNVPTTIEIENFFASAEQQQQRHFIEMYNFDIVNDVPLIGRYEWVRLNG